MVTCCRGGLWKGRVSNSSYVFEKNGGPTILRGTGRPPIHPAVGFRTEPLPGVDAQRRAAGGWQLPLHGLSRLRPGKSLDRTILRHGCRTFCVTAVGLIASRLSDLLRHVCRTYCVTSVGLFASILSDFCVTAVWLFASQLSDFLRHSCLTFCVTAVWLFASRSASRQSDCLRHGCRYFASRQSLIMRNASHRLSVLEQYVRSSFCWSHGFKTIM
jgi:hypothetical protein